MRVIDEMFATFMCCDLNIIKEYPSWAAPCWTGTYATSIQFWAAMFNWVRVQYGHVLWLGWCPPVLRTTGGSNCDAALPVLRERIDFTLVTTIGPRLRTAYLREPHFNSLTGIVIYVAAVTSAWCDPNKRCHFCRDSRICCILYNVLANCEIEQNRISPQHCFNWNLLSE